MDAASGASARPAPEELRAQRRAARLAGNRADILDAAERTFAERGLAEGSLRDIAKHAGFSTAAIYNYFDNKQHLLAETLARRGVELLDVIERAAASDTAPMAQLHAIVEGTVTFFARYPDFRRMLRHARESDATIAALEEYVGDRADLFPSTLDVMTRIVAEGQERGDIRQGSPTALIHLYMTLVYEHVFLMGSDNPDDALTLPQFQDLVEGALRPATPSRTQGPRES